MSDKKSFIFIVQQEDNSLWAGRQDVIDTGIKYYEDNGLELPFKVIGKIAEPRGHNTLPLDFNEKLIQWYEDTEKTPEFIKKAILAITEFRVYGK